MPAHLVQSVHIQQSIVECTSRQTAKLEVGAQHCSAGMETVGFCPRLLKPADPVLKETWHMVFKITNPNSDGHVGLTSHKTGGLQTKHSN